MTAGNNACRSSGRKDIWALAAIAEINKLRGADVAQQRSCPRTAHLIFSLKRPEEVNTLRKIYGPGFAAGYPATEMLSEVLTQLNETSLSQLRRDHETGHLGHKIAKASK